MPFIKIERLTNAVKVIGEELEDYIENEIHDAINVFKDDELEEARRDAYDDTREVDYRVDNADNEISDLKSEVRDLEHKLDELTNKLDAIDFKWEGV
jgi:predicted RNase H-like nuclease (RuvC/YqgF family)|tara:strand:+ start:124 stop:414 length:291 start_codon:yes stop_codon:yes gene_type:complete